MTRVKKATKEEVSEIKRLFLKHYPQSQSELRYTNAYELLVSIILSAQCTDKRVNIITPALFERFPTPSDLAEGTEAEVKEFIKSCTYFNNKTTSLLKMARSVVDEHGGEIPLEKEKLLTLGGVGEKTANVLLIEYCGANLMAVDTHVFRVSHRLGLSKAKTTKQTEADLTKVFQSDLHLLHQGMVLFGRYICKAKNPDCGGACFLQPFCKSTSGFKPG